MFDKLLVWGTEAGRPLWSPVFVDLETRLKPNTPWLSPDVGFSDADPLDATIHWTPPTWPSHKDLLCQFRYQRCQEETWTLVEPELSMSLASVEIQDLELASSYEVSGRCRVQTEEDLWGEWSPPLSFQTPQSAPKDVWVAGILCGTSSGQTPQLLWKAPESCVQVAYVVLFWAGGQTLTQEGLPCCNTSIPTWAEGASVSAVNASSWEPPTNLSLLCLAPGSAPRSVEVRSIPGRPELLVTWQQGSGETQEHVVDWAQDGDPLENFNWIWVPPGNLSALLPGTFTGGVPYRITVTAVSPWGLAPASSVWGFREELGPALWRLPDDPPGTPAIAWGKVPRSQLRGHLTHYTVCVRSGSRPPVCKNVSGSTQNITLPDLHSGPCEIWVTASTIAGQGPPGRPSLQLHLPDNSLQWKVLPGVLFLWGVFLLGCGLSLATSGRSLPLWHKVLPRWVWEKVPDPANSSFSQPHVEDVPQVQPPQDSPILEVEEIEPQPVTEDPRAATPIDSGYEKHFLPTAEELGLLEPHRLQVLA
ncbi:Interleukin-27 receptor subunit alpha [Tupaia chinensis]|uniref:Interleukin-27 receptor subunit alpha n=1 Tax=Tupaia chinensis TaxID=246437 RepID=L8YGQ1_TUPCH|nr:Interleukin-27 receptor subunit alpha [Tupaia chinensis]